MAIYEKCWESEELTTTQLEESSGLVINQDQSEAQWKNQQIPPKYDLL